MACCSCYQIADNIRKQSGSRSGLTKKGNNSCKQQKCMHIAHYTKSTSLLYITSTLQNMIWFRTILTTLYNSLKMWSEHISF